MSRENLEQVLLQGKEILDKAGIPFLLTGGTLLGVIREGHLLDWDTDVDVDILVEDLPREKKDLLGKIAEKKGLNLAHAQTDHEHGHMSILFTGCRFDIFPMYKKGNKRYRNVTQCVCHVWPAHHYDKDKWGKVKYLGKYWNVPHDLDNWMLTFFGKDWKKPDKDWVWDECLNKYELNAIKWEG